MSSLVLLPGSAPAGVQAPAGKPRPSPKNRASCINQYRGKCKTSSEPTTTPTKSKPKPATPAIPSGFQLVASDTGNSADGWLATPNDVTINNPVAVDIRVSGTGTVLTDANLVCSTGTGVPEVHRTFDGFGLFTLPVPAGSSSCDTIVGGDGNGPGAFIVQVYAQAGGSTPSPTTTTTPTTTPTPKPTSKPTVAPAVITLGSAGACTATYVTGTFQVTAANGVSWTAAGRGDVPNRNGQTETITANSGLGPGTLTVRIDVPPEPAFFGSCDHWTAEAEQSWVAVTFSDGTGVTVQVNWTFDYVD